MKSLLGHGLGCYSEAGAGARLPGEQDPAGDQGAARHLDSVIRSSRRTSAKTAARNGLRFATSVAREAPIRCSERNQRMFVRTSGPSVAKTSSAQISQPRP